MKSYPTGVMQNHAAPGFPLELRPVGEQNWRMFAPPTEASDGLKMIQAAAPNAFMTPVRTGQYSQFIYRIDKNPPIVVRIAYGQAVADNGNVVAIQEYPSDIYDRSITPQPFVDSVEPGKKPLLKCREIAPDLGELYWTTADQK